MKSEHTRGHVPAWLKWAYTAFLLVLVPVYWANYGPTNFLYFCDVALFLALLAMWTEKPIFASMAAVGILVPQLLWCLDFVTELFGLNLVGMTSYMFDEKLPLFLRGLSLFHGWLPFLLLFLVIRLGYDRRGFVAWTVTAVILCLIAYFFLPPAGSVLHDPKTPMNINYVFGFDDKKPQTWMSANLYLVVWIAALTSLAYLPTHLFLKRFTRATA
ncbi:hypothetical protein AYO49_01415 [Verrucomicrobiaceae bacterium SCGC AG-212-N21]|nr:hypothetical protein AYO49_01415 [Verrucomicrobiaceae bacterium SCGC AG-212-N21]